MYYGSPWKGVNKKPWEGKTPNLTTKSVEDGQNPKILKLGSTKANIDWKHYDKKTLIHFEMKN